MSSHAEQKKRPPPIQIPSHPPAPMVPGPNAFAIAAKMKQESVGKQQQPQPGAHRVPQKKQTVRSDSHPPAPSPVDDTPLLPPASESHSQRSRGSAMTTFTQLIE